MTVADVIERTHEPVTTDSLARDLGRLGVGADDVVLVHSSLSSLGWVNGGAVAVIQALLRAVGPGGTLVMPTHSTELTDPANWRAPPVPSEWIETIRATMPPYDPAGSPSFSVLGQEWFAVAIHQLRSRPWGRLPSRSRNPIPSMILMGQAHLSVHFTDWTQRSC